MLSSAADSRLQMMAFFWYGTAMIVALILGYFLATDVLQIFLMVVGTAWLVLLPYHSFLAIVLSVSTFSSALIVPFFPGRPFVWEMAALLAWSGLIITISLRRYPTDAGIMIARHRWLFLGMMGYCLSLIHI